MSDVPGTKPYFATLPADELIGELHGKIEGFYNDLLETGIYALLDRLYRAYYGANLAGKSGTGQIFDSAELGRGGKSGEIVKAKVNHFRSLIRHALQLATSTKPAYACRATNSDYKSQSQAVLGNGLIDYYLREKKLQGFLTKAVENGYVIFEGWIHGRWSATSGEVYGRHPETGAEIKEGDVEYSVHTLLDVVRDVNRTDDEEHLWRCVRRKENRFDLAARHPELADRILSASCDDYRYENMESFAFNLGPTRKDEDLLTVWTFYHMKSDSMEAGRIFEFVADIPLIDGPIPYRQIPLHRFSPDRLIGTCYGYSPAVDILGPQQALDILDSTIMTNQAAHGVQSVWTKKGDPLTVTQLGSGMKNLQSEVKPEPVQLTHTAPEIFNRRQELIGEMETIFGISATVRGNPEANLKSGSALALVVSQSVQFASMSEAAYNTLIEDVGTDLINLLRDFSQTKRVAIIMGASSRPFQKTFSADDLAQINRVVVEATSPLSKTISGRLEIAKDLFDKGLIETPKQYVNILLTGQLEPAIEGSTHELLNIRAENEELREGRPGKALITDLHPDHVKEHRSILSNPEARKNPALIAQTTQHIQEHINLWRSMDPALLMLLNLPPPPPPPAPPGMMPPPGAGGPPAAGAPGPGGPGPAPGAQVMAKTGPTEAQMPRDPNMPSLPPGSPEGAQAAYQKVS
jgi:hypothetical protein